MHYRLLRRQMPWSPIPIHGAQDEKDDLDYVRTSNRMRSGRLYGRGQHQWYRITIRLRKCEPSIWRVGHGL